MKILIWVTTLLVSFNLCSEVSLSWSPQRTSNIDIKNIIESGQQFLVGGYNSLVAAYCVSTCEENEGIHNFLSYQGVTVATPKITHRKFSTVTTAGLRQTLVLQHPSLFGEILRSKRQDAGADPEKNPFSGESELGAPFKDTYMGILTNAKVHDVFRASARGFLDPHRFSDIINEEVELFFTTHLSDLGSKKDINFHLLTSRIMVRFLLGDKSLKEVNIEQLISDVDHLSKLMLKRLLNPYINNDQLKTEAKRRLTPLITLLSEGSSFRKYPKTTVNEQVLTEDDMVEACIAFFFAGIDNVAWSLHHLFIALGDEQHKKYWPNVSYNKYRDNLIKENLRLWPVIYGMLRDVKTALSITIDDEKGQHVYNLPSGSLIHLDTLAANRNSDFYGDDAQLFNPDRFLEQTGRAHQLWDLTFGQYGSSCLGKRLTLAVERAVLSWFDEKNIRWKSYINGERVREGFHPLEKSFNLRINGKPTYRFYPLKGY